MWTSLRFAKSSLSSFAAAAVGCASVAAFASASPALNEAEEKKVALDPKEFRAFRVSHVDDVNYNTKRIVFDLPSADHEMGMTVASCLLARGKVDGKNVARPYTPTNLNSEKGQIELVVKGYPTGKLSKHICELQVGDTLEMKGPYVKFKYEPNMYKSIGMIAGGSGLTPMLQVAKEICRNPQDDTQIVLVFANNSEQDIFLRDELDAMQYLYPQFKVYHVLSNAPENWTGYSGYISKEMVEELLPPPSDDNLICVCGPPPMMYHVSGDKAKDKSQGELQGLLKDLKYTSKQVFKF